MKGLNRLYLRRKELGLTLEEVGNIVGVGKSTVRKWENGLIANMRRDKIVLLAKALQVEPDFILETSLMTNEPKSIVSVPILGTFTTPLTDEEFEEVSCPKKNEGKLIAFIVDGNAMMPRFAPGDIIIVRQQLFSENGDYVVLTIGEKNPILRLCKKEPLGITLVPSNPAYELLRFTHEEVKSMQVKLLGVVMESRCKYKEY